MAWASCPSVTSRNRPFPGMRDPAVIQRRPDLCVEVVADLLAGQGFDSLRVDLSSHNANPPDVFDGEPIPMSHVADTRIAESVAALRRFVAEHDRAPAVHLV